MKELSIEEKAKRYDEASMWMEGIYPTLTHEQQGEAEAFFPIFKENEDKETRKRIIALINAHGQGRYKEEMLAWFEKQDKQEPFNYENINIQQKDFAPKSALEAINEEKVDNANKVEPRQEELTEFEKAVKQVMEEAIECGDTHNLKADADMLLSLVHKSAWSEDDELHIRELESLVKRVWTTAEHENDKDTIHKMSDLSFFLKTLKPHPKQEWSEEDKNRFTNLISLVKCSKENDATKVGFIEFINKLKSLSLKTTWKPSDEQIEALKDAVSDAIWQYDFKGSPLKEEVTRKHTETIKSLYNDLKKLKG